MRDWQVRSCLSYILRGLGSNYYFKYLKEEMAKVYIIGAVLFLAVVDILCNQVGDISDGSTLSYRLLVAQDNKAKIVNHNARKERSFTMKEYPQFIDQTAPELSAKLLMKFPRNFRETLISGSKSVLVQSPKPSSKPMLSFLPSRERRVNWTQQGMVSPVRQQGMCGSCYAFAALADIQSSFLFKGKRLDLSEQHIIDCSRPFGNDGCNGGWMAHVFAYAMLKGITTQGKYPMLAQTFIQGISGPCQQERGEFKIKSYSYTSYKTYDCDSLANMIVKRPVTVAVAVDFNFFFYWSGVLDQCGQQLNHGVLLTGLIQSYPDNYWIVKNSWGEWWGIFGYANIDRYSKYGNLCEICYAPAYSIV